MSRVITLLALCVVSSVALAGQHTPFDEVLLNNAPTVLLIGVVVIVLSIAGKAIVAQPKEGEQQGGLSGSSVNRALAGVMCMIVVGTLMLSFR